MKRGDARYCRLRPTPASRTAAGCLQSRNGDVHGRPKLAFGLQPVVQIVSMLDIPRTVPRALAGALREKLRGMEPETLVDASNPLRRIIMSDPAVNPQDYQATFVGRDFFTVLAPQEESFRQQVDKWFNAPAP